MEVSAFSPVHANTKYIYASNLLYFVLMTLFLFTKQAIARHGGDVDTTYSKRCTHLLCLHQQGDIFKKVIESL